MDMPEFIRSSRQKVNKTQEELSREIRITVAAVSRWERGINNPKPEHVPALAKALEVPESSLYELIPEAANTTTSTETSKLDDERIAFLGDLNPENLDTVLALARHLWGQQTKDKF